MSDSDEFSIFEEPSIEVTLDDTIELSKAKKQPPQVILNTELISLQTSFPDSFDAKEYIKDIGFDGLVIGEHFRESNGRRQIYKIVFGIGNYQANLFTHNIIRSLCIQLGIKQYHGLKKDDLLEMLATRKLNLQAYDHIDPKFKQPKNKDINCTLRLFNVMFSDKFVPKFMEMGNQPTRHELDTNNIPETAFWKEVLLDYLDISNPNYGKLQYQHQALRKKGINPSKFAELDWRKLQSTFRFVRGLWATAMGNVTKSGEHEEDFWLFCNGRLDVLYLYLHTQTKPELITAVTTNMPETATFDSENYNVEDLVSQNKSLCGKQRSTSSKKKVKEDFHGQMLEAFTKAADNSKATDLLEKQTNLLVQREQRLAKKNRVDYEFAIKENDYQSLKHFSEFNEHLRKLRSELANEPIEANQTSIRDEIVIYEQKVATIKRSMLLPDESRKLTYDDSSIDMSYNDE